MPAITAHFSSPSVEQQLVKTIRDREQSNKVVFIFGDVPTASFLFCLRQVFPSVPMAVRSQNVVSKIFEGFQDEGNLLSRIAWKIEVTKIRRFERRVLEEADRFWAISETDSEEYSKRFDMRPQGVFGVSVDPSRYENIACGAPFILLYLGSADLRKGKGISRFIRHAWKVIRTIYPSAQFLLAGRNTEQFTHSDLGIFGSGFCQNERDFLGQGLIFVNPQEHGSGIKLKSITAMLAGKALVSTEVGVEGIAGKPGEHFLVAKRAADLTPLVIKLMGEPEVAQVMGRKAQELARKAYSDENLTATAMPLLQDLASLAS